MARRNHVQLPSSLNRAVTERHVIHHHLEDRVAIQHREIQSLLLENQRLAASHLTLKQELALAQQELRHLSAASDNVKAERDAEVREVYERSLKMDTEARTVVAMSAELARVRADVQNFAVDHQELTAQLEAVNEELSKARADAKQVPVIKTDIETLRLEIQRGRAAIEQEKKTRAINLEEHQKLEKNRTVVAQELERLHAECANVEKRGRAGAANAVANPNPTYNGNYGAIDAKYGGSAYPDPRSISQADAVAHFMHGSMSNAPIEGQGSHTPYENQPGPQFVSGATSDSPRENRVVQL